MSRLGPVLDSRAPIASASTEYERLQAVRDGGDWKAATRQERLRR